MLQVALLPLVPLAGDGEELGSVLAHRLEQPIPRGLGSKVNGHERRAHELVQHLVRRWTVLVEAYGGKCIELAATGEHTHRPQGGVRGCGQELCAPVEGGMHRAVAGHDAVAGQFQLLDRPFEPIGEIRQRQRPAACRGELEPERDAVQTTAHGGHGHGVVRAQRAGRHVDRQPGDEQCARRRVLDLLQRG